MIKIYTNKKKVTYEMADHLGHEKIKRDIIHRLINDIPIEQLEKMFNIVILDPNSKECKEKVKKSHIDKDVILHNAEEKTIQYEVSLTIDQD